MVVILASHFLLVFVAFSVATRLTKATPMPSVNGWTLVPLGGIYVLMMLWLVIAQSLSPTGTAMWFGLPLVGSMLASMGWMAPAIRSRIPFLSLPWVAVPMCYSALVLCLLLLAFILAAVFQVLGGEAFQMLVLIWLFPCAPMLVVSFAVGAFITLAASAKTRGASGKLALWTTSVLLFLIPFGSVVRSGWVGFSFQRPIRPSVLSVSVIDALNLGPGDERITAFVVKQAGEEAARRALGALESAIISPALQEGLLLRHNSLVQIGEEVVDDGWRCRALVLVNALDPDRGLQIAARILEGHRVFDACLRRHAAAIMIANDEDTQQVSRIIRRVSASRVPFLAKVDPDRSRYQGVLERNTAELLMLLNTAESTKWLDDFVRAMRGWSFGWKDIHAQALRTLLQRKPSEYEALLSQMLSGGDSTKRWVAVRGFGASKDPAAFSQLMAVLQKTKDPKEYQAALQALGEMGHREAVAVLLQVASGEVHMSGIRQWEEAEIRQRVIESLGRAGSSQAIQSLVGLLDVQGSDVLTNRFTAQAIARALVDIGDPAATPFLTELLHRSVTAELTSGDLNLADRTFEIVEGLGRIGDERALPALEQVRVGYQQQQLVQNPYDPWPQLLRRRNVNAIERALHLLRERDRQRGN